MSWARYDDEFPMNRKVGRLVGQGQAGIAAIGLHVLANTYARHNGTAGVIEPHVPGLLCGGAIGKKLARMLAEVGMFDERPEGGWTIHDYAEYHDPKDPDPDRSAADRKKELSEKRAEAGRRGGLAKAARNTKQTASNATDLPEANGVAKPWQCSTPVPVPDPVITDPEGSSSSHRPPDDDKPVDNYTAVADQLARLKTEAAKPDSPSKYLRTVRANIDTEDGPSIRRLLDLFPTATAHQLAAAVLTGDTRTLAPHARTEPT